ncbi:ras family-domain-containing protein [Mycena olivaceomarginata]|nr:ras family-domain-containing protein [Mycena olivaceomarginata]
MPGSGHFQTAQEMIDTAGQEEYATLRDQWVKEGQGFVLVYSIASRTTFDRLETFRQSVTRAKANPILMLVGNKCDEVHAREVCKAEGEALVRQFGCNFIETSAKTAQNVEQGFTSLVRAIRQATSKNLVPGTTPNSGKPREKKCIIL